jgi:hypothetical protein
MDELDLDERPILGLHSDPASKLLDIIESQKYQQQE